MGRILAIRYFYVVLDGSNCLFDRRYSNYAVSGAICLRCMCYTTDKGMLTSLYSCIQYYHAILQAELPMTPKNSKQIS